MSDDEARREHAGLDRLWDFAEDGPSATHGSAPEDAAVTRDATAKTDAVRTEVAADTDKTTRRASMTIVGLVLGLSGLSTAAIGLAIWMVKHSAQVLGPTATVVCFAAGIVLLGFFVQLPRLRPKLIAIAAITGGLAYVGDANIGWAPLTGLLVVAFVAWGWLIKEPPEEGSSWVNYLLGWFVSTVELAFILVGVKLRPVGPGVSKGKWLRPTGALVALCFLAILACQGGYGATAFVAPLVSPIKNGATGSGNPNKNGATGSGNDNGGSSGGQARGTPRTEGVVPPAPGAVYFSDQCGWVMLLPQSHHVPAELVVELQDIFYNDEGAPGSSDGAAGCPGMLEPVPNHRDVLYFYGYSSTGHTLSVGTLWQDPNGSWEGSLVLDPAIKCFWSLTLRWGRVRASVGGPGRPLDHVGQGNVIVLTASNGTTILVRQQKWSGPGDQYPAPFVRLDPPAADLFIGAMRRHNDEWLWPVPVASSPGTRRYDLIHDPITRDIVDEIEYPTSETSGSQISVDTVLSLARTAP